MSKNELSVDLNLRLEKLEASFSKAQKVANDNMKQIERTGEQAARKLDIAFAESAARIAESFMRVGTDVAPAVAAGLTLYRTFNKAGAAITTVSRLFGTYHAAIATVTAVGLALNEAKETILELRKIATDSEAAGLAPSFLQSWIAQAKEARIESDAMQGALANARGALRERSDEQGRIVQNSVGAMLDELYRGGKVTGTGLGEFLNAGDTASKIQAIKIALSEMLAQGRELQALKLSEMVFGAGVGERMVEGIRSGAIAVEAVGAQAKQVGNVFRDDLVKRAEELDVELQKARDQMASGLLPISQELAAVGLQIQNGWVNVNQLLADAITKTGNLVSVASKVRSVLWQLNPQRIAAELLNESRNNTRVKGELNAGRQGGVDASFIDASKAFPAPTSTMPANPPTPPVRPPISRMRDVETPTGGAGRAAPSGGGSTSLDNVNSYIDRLTKSVAMLEAEHAALGKSNSERERLVRLAEAEGAARQRGTPLTDEERAKIEALAAWHAKLSGSIEKSKAARQGMHELAELGTNAITDMIVEGKKFEDVANQLLKTLAKLALQAAFMRTGPLASVFGMSAPAGTTGGIFGALGFAEGGQVRGPGTGTSDSIPARLSAGEFVVNAQATARHRGVLEAINNGQLPRFAAGGLVGVGSPPPLASAGAQGVTIAPSIAVTVEGGSRGPEADEELGQNVAKQIEASVRGLVCDELRRQRRPGNMLWS